MIRQANPFAAFASGQRMGQQMQETRRQNALYDLYREQGAQIASGDAGALASLAQYDPMAARQITRQNQADAFQREQFEYRQGRDAAVDARADREFEFRLKEFERTATREEKAQAAAEAQQVVAIISTADTPERWDALAEQYGATEYIGQFENREAIQARYMTIADVLKRQEVPGPADEYQRYVAEEQAAGREPLSRIDYAQAKKGQGVVMTTPDGTTLRVGGSGDTKFTEGQSKDNVYSTRARGALETLEPVAGELTSLGGHAAEKDPTGFARRWQSDEFQVAWLAGQEFLQAILRKDTGAAITEQEQDLYGGVYLPRPGDSPAALEAKRQARIRAINAIEAGMSPAQMLAQERALRNSAEEASGTPSQAQESGIQRPENVPQEVWDAMTPEGREAFR